MMVTKIKDIALLVMFFIIIMMTIFRSGKCPETDKGVIDTTTITLIDTIEVPGPTKWKDTIIYKPVPVSVTPTDEPVPQLISTYIDTLILNGCEIGYNATVLGELREMGISARRTSNTIIKITDTKYITREVERKVQSRALWIGGGLGGTKDVDSKIPSINRLPASVLYTSRKNAYELEYDVLNGAVEAKVFLKLF